MTVIHLKKLCVGAENVDILYERQCTIRKKFKKTIHITRMFPKKYIELRNGGSIFWVFKGYIKARQSILDIERFTGKDSIKRCKIFLSDEIILTTHKKERPFQGWRYFEDKDIPSDIELFDQSKFDSENENLVSELSKLGLV